MKITIIGCGNGAFAAAADLTSRGHEVTLYVDRSHEKNFRTIAETKTIICRGTGPQGPVRLKNVTCDEKEAFQDYDLVMPVVTATAHEDIAARVAPYLKDGTDILLAPGSTGGALVFAKVFRDLIPEKNIRICEIHTLPYTARKVGSDGVNISLFLDFMLFAAFPARFNEEMYALIKPLYPSIRLCHDVLETSLNNGNATTHPAPMVLNAGKIEYYGKHSHYAEGITPSVGRVVQAVDDERKAICRAFGYDELDIKERLYKMGYCPLRETVYESIQGSTDVFLPIPGPDDLGNRYLTEDTPCSLVAMSEIGELAGVKTPFMDAIITLASGLRSEDYRESGRTLERMGIDGLNIEQLKEYLQTGRRP